MSVLFAAPHRLLFLTGVTALLLSLLWWSAALLGLHTGVSLPDTLVHRLPLHGPLMLYLVLPALFLGFLLTVFPRWTGYPDFPASIHAPIALLLAASIPLLWAGVAFDLRWLVSAAFLSAGLSCAGAIVQMLRLLTAERRDGKGPTWHGWSILAAMLCGVGGLALAGVGLHRLDGELLRAANRIGLFLFALPVFVTVAHRMIPFFAGNVVADYMHWRPFWWLAAFWAGSVALTAGDLLWIAPLAVAGALMLAGLTLLAIIRWWPRGQAPGLLWVLMIGFAWAPLGYALEAAAQAGVEMGLAADHALTIGLAGSLIVAMVTRVTHGHSGRPLAMVPLAWIAFAGVQLSAVTRLAAGLMHEHPHALLTSAVVFAIAAAPWLVRNALIYLTPRRDGRPG